MPTWFSPLEWYHTDKNLFPLAYRSTSEFINKNNSGFSGTVIFGFGENIGKNNKHVTRLHIRPTNVFRVLFDIGIVDVKQNNTVL